MLIYAPNIHQGGGKVLLLDVLDKQKNIQTLICDSRLNLDLSKMPYKVIQVRPNILSRLYAEFVLLRASLKHKNILCFSNLPPILPLKTKVHLFFQNTLILNKNKHYRTSIKNSFKKKIERLWLKIGLKNTKYVYIQSETLAEKFQSCFPNCKVKVIPFAPEYTQIDHSIDKKLDFIYLASGDPHKNHLNLLQAWEILAKEGLYPNLTLTVDSNYTELISKIDILTRAGVKITNLNLLSHQKALSLYTQAKALIYPSFTESFGLPLIEAQHYKLPIVASELDYVRDFVTPAETFDPKSPRSIARAVKRFLKIEPQLKTQKLYSTKDFIAEISNELEP